MADRMLRISSPNSDNSPPRKGGKSLANTPITKAEAVHIALSSSGYFKDAAQRRFDLVLVWAVDHLTREGVAETFEYIKRLSSHGVLFVSFTEEHFRTTGPAGELMIAVAAWIAKQESLRISERVRAGFDRIRTQGTRSGRPVGRPRVAFHRDQVVELRQQGRSWREIASKLRAGATTVRRVWAGAQACQDPGKAVE